ncbi:MAG: hypothetical protein KGJ02_02945 [Verrucomicrobiota bacterium]|nr:hypothetical protein [Verrucomicrobiota bacterium]
MAGFVPQVSITVTPRQPELKDCAICLGELGEMDLWTHRGGQRHPMHRECIEPWLENNVTCPVCRQVVVSPPSSRALISTKGVSYYSLYWVSMITVGYIATGMVLEAQTDWVHVVVAVSCLAVGVFSAYRAAKNCSPREGRFEACLCSSCLGAAAIAVGAVIRLFYRFE